MWIPRATGTPCVCVGGERSVVSFWLLSTEGYEKEFIFHFELEVSIGRVCMRVQNTNTFSQSHSQFGFMAYSASTSWSENN